MHGTLFSQVTGYRLHNWGGWGGFNFRHSLMSRRLWGESSLLVNEYGGGGECKCDVKQLSVI